jgi:hypothetical protein
MPEIRAAVYRGVAHPVIFRAMIGDPPVDRLFAVGKTLRPYGVPNIETETRAI